MRSLQLILGAYLAGQGWSQHMQDEDVDPALLPASSAALLPGLGCNWTQVVARQRHRSGRTPVTPR